MHLRKLVLACGFASFALSNYASALGLGEVKLKSTLNQPLRADVQLLDTRDLTAEQIIVALASPADFERNGVERLYFYTEFQFQVILDNPGGPIVRITTRNPVREPYLNFLIEARWTAGRLLREYTVLMDLPTFDDAPASAVQSPETTKSKPSPAAKAKIAAPSKEASVSPTAAAPEAKPDIIAEQDQKPGKSAGSSGTYGPIGDKDTLWEIAKAVRPDGSVSVHQTMLALQRLNPDAFIHNNINLIKKGQVLRVPDATEIASVSKTEAVHQVNSQISDWSGTSTAATGLGAQLDASRHTSNETVKNEPVAGRVKLEAPSAANSTGNGNGSGANKGSGKALEKELASSLEELDKAKSEKSELSSRVHDLEDQVKTMQRLLDVSNEKLRAMQLNADANKAVTSASVASPVAAVASSAPVSSASAVEAPAPAPAASSAPAVTSAAASSAPKVATPKQVINNKPAEKSLVDQLSDYFPWLGLGIVVLAGAGYAIIRRRRAQVEEPIEPFEPEPVFESEPDFNSFSHLSNDLSEAEVAQEETPLFDEEDSTAVAETGDVVGEADIYIAYGKFDQAEEMLLNGLAKDPASVDIRLKLLEVYSQTQNAVEFDKQYAAILPLASGFALTRAAELRSNIEDAGEFAGDIPEHAASPSLFDENYSLDDDFAQTQKALDEDFDFSLDLDDDATKDVNAATQHYDMDFGNKESGTEASSATVDDDFLLDFDLDDEANKKAESQAEDLSDISLALDELDDDILAGDIELPPASNVVAEEEDFTFDFDEIEETPSPLAQEVEHIKAPDDETPGDDFNLEMDVDDVDLAALDHEMESLDADLDSLDADESIEDAEPEHPNPSFADQLAELDAEFNESEPLAHEDALVSEGIVNSEAEVVFESDVNRLEEDELAFDAEAFAVNEPIDINAPDLSSEEVIEDLAWSEVSDGEDNPKQADALADDELDLELAEADTNLATNELTESDLDLDADDFDENELISAPDAAMESDSGVDAEILAEDDTIEDLTDDDFNLDDDDFELESSGSNLEELEASFENDDLDFDLPEKNASVSEEDADFLTEESLAPAADDNDIHEDDVFEQALSDFSAEGLAMDDSADMSDDDLDAELDFADADEAATKLDLARAYIDMGDNDGARDILAEVAHEGNEQQRQEAVDLLSRIDV